MTSTALKIGIAGLGTVGAAVFRLINQNADLLAQRAGRPVVVTAVSARSRDKNRDIDTALVTWHDNPVALADDDNVDVVVEVMGGADGAAYDLTMRALDLGKPVISANKALIALNGASVLEKLGTSTGSLSYEAAVAGGVPVIKTLREGMAANDIRAVYGILNGTCNFILSEMAVTGRDFADVLQEAQMRGYAEADPTFDIDGLDTAHKLSILAALAFGAVPDARMVDVRGIRDVSAFDIAAARELGYRIKLLGIAKRAGDGVLLIVEPCLIPEKHPVAHVDGALNAVYTDGDRAGKILMVGAGAGGDATASAIVGDIIDVARGRALPFLGGGGGANALTVADPASGRGSYFLRLVVLDKPGVIADISAILRDCGVSLESVLQRGRAPGQAVPLILTSHETRAGDMRVAVDRIANLASVVESPHMMRIEEFDI